MGNSVMGAGALAQPAPRRQCHHPVRKHRAALQCANPGVPSSAGSTVRLPPCRGERVPNMAASWAWHEPGLPRRNGNESKTAPGAPHLPCNMAQLVPTPVQNEPGLAISTPTFSFAVGYSCFTLIFHKAVEYRRCKVMDNPYLQYS